MAFTNVGPSITTTNVPQSTFGNVQQFAVLAVTLTPVAVAVNTTAEQTFFVTGLLVTDVVFPSKLTSQPGIAVVGARVSATGTLAITYVNSTAGAVTPNPEIYTLVVIRPQPFQTVNSVLPSAMPLL